MTDHEKDFVEIDIEEVAMNLIVCSGSARSLAFEALNAAKQQQFDKAAQLIKQSEAEGLAAHAIQTDVLANEANGNKTEICLLFVHAQDHLMTSMLARELVQELIVLHRDKQNKEG